MKELLKTWVSFIWFLVCLNGNGIQVYHLSYQYFSYEMNTNIRLHRNEHFVVPSVTLCFDTFHIIDWKKLSRKEVEIVTRSIVEMPDDVLNEATQTSEIKKAMGSLNVFQRMAVVANLFKNFKTSYIITNMTLDADKILEEHMSIGYLPKDNHYNFITISEFYHITTYMRDLTKCFLFDIKDEFVQDIDYDKLQRQPMFSFLFNTLALKTNVAESKPQFHYMLGPRKTILYAGFPAFLTFSSEVHRVYFLSYDEYEEHLLPPPFETQCRIYTEPNAAAKSFECQAKCYESCFTDKSIEITGSILPGAVLRVDNNESIIPTFDMSSRLYDVTHLRTGKTISITEAFKEVSDTCEEFCRQKDCDIRSFFPRLTGSVYSVNEPYFVMIFQVRQTPLTFTQYLQQYSLAQFLVDMVSSFGFWLGLSALGVLGSIQQMHQSVQGVFKKYNKSVVRVNSINIANQMTPRTSLQKSKLLLRHQVRTKMEI